MAKRLDVKVKDTSDLPVILTIGEAAELARIGREKIYAACRRGDFPCRQLGSIWRIPRDSFIQFLKNA